MLKIIELVVAKKNNCYDLIATSEGATCIHRRKESETPIQWPSLKYDHALISHFHVMVKINF